MQTVRDGKSIIIEGLHLDPGLYLHEFGKDGIRHLHSRADSMLPSQQSMIQTDDTLAEPANALPLSTDRNVQKVAAFQPESAGLPDRYATRLSRNIAL